MATGALTAAEVAERDPIAPEPPRALEPSELTTSNRRKRTSNPLLAVAGLCGGAGASTLAYLIARSAVVRSDQPVLLCDAGGPTGGIAFYAGVRAPRSLAGAANVVGGAAPPTEGLFAGDPRGLRVLAGGPDLEDEVDPDGLTRLISDARDAHALTVVDCGTLRGRPERHALAAASHVAWVLPATVSGVGRARRVLELVGPVDAQREMIVARQDAGGRSAPTEELADLAATRSAPLVLMPHIEDLAEGDSDVALERVELTVEAVRTVVRW